MQFDCYEYNYSIIALKCMRLPTNHIALPLRPSYILRMLVNLVVPTYIDV